MQVSDPPGVIKLRGRVRHAGVKLYDISTSDGEHSAKVGLGRGCATRARASSGDCDRLASKDRRTAWPGSPIQRVFQLTGYRSVVLRGGDEAVTDDEGVCASLLCTVNDRRHLWAAI